MTYNKTTWSDRQVQYPMQFSAAGAVSGTVTLTPDEGNIIQAGTPITAVNLNNIENGVANNDSRLTTIEGRFDNNGNLISMMPNVAIRGRVWSGIVSTNVLNQFPSTGSLTSSSLLNGFHLSGNDIICDVAGRYVIAVWATISGLNDQKYWDILIRYTPNGGSYGDDINGVYGYSGLGNNYNAPEGALNMHEIVRDLGVGDMIQIYTRAGEAPRNINNYGIKIYKIG